MATEAPSSRRQEDRMKKLGLVAVALSIVFAAPARAADFYVDPQNGSMANDGSAAKPWRTLQEVIDAKLIESQGWESLPPDGSTKLVAKNAGAPVKKGDTIWLRSGLHGSLSIVGYYNPDWITIAAEAGHTPKFSSVLLRAGAKWRLRGFVVSAELAEPYETRTLIDIEAHNWHGPISDIEIEGCELSSKADVSSWTMQNWDELACTGIQADGERITIRNNRLKNVDFGISVGARDSLVQGNVVDSFAGDGLRGLGDNTVFEGNTVKNCYDVNANHDDGFQSWSSGEGGVGTGEVKGIVLRGNVFINYEDPNQPFRGTLQGIGCFDGMYVDWVVENNVVITDHWHGITFLGAKNVRVVNNTVIDSNTEDPGPPWIRISEHKNGTAPEGCLVRNNLTTALNLSDTGVTQDHNLVIQDPGTLFVNPAGFDLHLLPGAADAIDKGSSEQSPATDLEGVPRPQGAGVDLGAYEWHDGTVGVDGGAAGSSGAAGVDAGAAGKGGGATGGIAGADAGVAGGDAGVAGAQGDASVSEETSADDGGCGCRAAGRGGWGWPGVLAMGLGGGVLRRRRRGGGR